MHALVDGCVGILTRPCVIFQAFRTRLTWDLLILYQLVFEDVVTMVLIDGVFSMVPVNV